MKYELEPDNRNCGDDVLLDDVKGVALRLGKASITKEDYDQHGRFSSATMQNRFGSWNQALMRSGCTVQKRVNIPREELLSDLKRVASELGTATVPRDSYRALGKFADITLSRVFGSWTKALEAAELCVPVGSRRNATEEELFSNMANVWEHVGRQPRQSDFQPPISSFSDSPYAHRFGSWRKALEAFVKAANGGELPREEVELPKPQDTVALSHIQCKRKTSRDPSWRLRFLVMRRDRFTCRSCGRSPALEPGLILHVDHIEAWSKGGETIMENLQTLCQRCNIGKSDLPMNEDE
jgi:hypothetical protein